MATADIWENVLRTNRSHIQLLIDLDSGGLWGALKTLEVFTKRELDCIWPPGKKMTIDRVEKLLEMLEKKPFQTFTKFCDALNTTGQERLVKEALTNVRTCETDGQSPSLPGDSVDGAVSTMCCPLSHLKCFLLKRHWNYIVETMVTDADVFGKMTEKKIFTEFQLKSLKEIPEESPRNEMLLHRLEKASEWQYDTFCDIMTATGQLVIVNYLRHAISIAQNPSSNEQTASVYQETSSDAVATSPPSVQMPVPRQPYKEESPPKDLARIKFGAICPEFLKKIARNVENEIAYKCDSQTRGRAIIISNEYFTHKLRQRHGAGEDIKNLKFLFQMLQFETNVSENLTAKEIRTLLKTESVADHHRNYDAFVLFLLSHGRKGEIYGQDETTVSIDEITTLFDGKNCSQLINKPKLFFIQACQGAAKPKTGIGLQRDSDSPLPADSSTDLNMEILRSNQNNQLEEGDQIIPVGEFTVETIPEKKDAEIDCSTVDDVLTGDVEPYAAASASSVPEEIPVGNNLENPHLVHDFEGSRPMDEVDQAIQSEDCPIETTPEEEKYLVNDLDLAYHLEQSLHIEIGYDRIQSDDDSTSEGTHEKADMAIAYSTVGGFDAFRDPEKGSFFVQCILEVFSKRSHEEDLLSMLTEVFNKLHEQTWNNRKLQIGEKRDTLRRKVYLLPRQDIHAENNNCPAT